MEIYHIVVRGVDRRKIFLDDQDRARFIHDLYEFNDENPAVNSKYYFDSIKEVGLPYIERKARNLLVHIFAFILMDNHYHLLVCVLGDGFLTKFMRKLNTGYVNYFNLKYSRTGTLFEGKYKSILVENEAHFAHLPCYIHLNALDMFKPQWRERSLEKSEIKESIDYLSSYRWSSHMDYVGIKNFPSVTQREFYLDFYGGREGYLEAITNWLQAPKMNLVEGVTLESTMEVGLP